MNESNITEVKKQTNNDKISSNETNKISIDLSVSDIQEFSINKENKAISNINKDEANDYKENYFSENIKYSDNSADIDEEEEKAILSYKINKENVQVYGISIQTKTEYKAEVKVNVHENKNEIKTEKTDNKINTKCSDIGSNFIYNNKKSLYNENPYIAFSTVSNFVIEDDNVKMKKNNNAVLKDMFTNNLINSSNLNNTDSNSKVIKNNELNEIKISNNGFSILNIEAIIAEANNDEQSEVIDFNLNEVYSKYNLEFPISKIMFSPNHTDLLVTIDTELSLYKLTTDYPNNNISTNADKDNNTNLINSHEHIINSVSNEEQPKLELNKIKLEESDEEYPAPLTSFDWNRYNKGLLVTSSIDTTCTVWDLNVGTVVTRLIAHDKEVFDVAFHNNDKVFCSCGADSSVRLFDLRDLDCSSILFEAPESAGLTRISISSNNDVYLLATPIDKPYFYLIDLRDTTSPLAIVQRHSSIVNCIQWSNEKKDLSFLSSSDDGSLYCWDLDNIHNKTPKYEFFENEPINNFDYKEDIVALSCLDSVKVMKF